MRLHYRLVHIKQELPSLRPFAAAMSKDPTSCSDPDVVYNLRCFRQLHVLARLLSTGLLPLRL